MNDFDAAKMQTISKEITLTNLELATGNRNYNTATLNYKGTEYKFAFNTSDNPIDFFGGLTQEALIDMEIQTAMYKFVQHELD